MTDRTAACGPRFAAVTLPNPSSVGLYAALGFQPVGTFHRVGYKSVAWHDVNWLQNDLEGFAYSRPPAEPH